MIIARWLNQNANENDCNVIMNSINNVLRQVKKQINYQEVIMSMTMIDQTYNKENESSLIIE